MPSRSASLSARVICDCLTCLASRLSCLLCFMSVVCVHLEVARVVESETFGANVNVTTYRSHAYLWLTLLVWRLPAWLRVKHLVLM